MRHINIKIDDKFQDEFKLLLDINMIEYEIIESDNNFSWKLNLNDIQLEELNKFLYIHKINS